MKDVKPAKKWSWKFKILIILGALVILLPLLAIPIFIIIYIFVARPTVISGIAMEPNYVNGQYYMIDKLGYKIGSPQLKDVIIFKYPKDERIDFISRIIAVPNDTLELDGNKLLINGGLYSEKIRGGLFLPPGKTIYVPQDKFFVLGDNFVYSHDSRDWGFVSKESIEGKIWFCYANCR